MNKGLMKILEERKTIIPRGPVRAKSMEVLTGTAENLATPEVQSGIVAQILSDNLQSVSKSVITQAVKPSILKVLKR